MAERIYYTEICSPLGAIFLTATDRGLSGLYFVGQKHWPKDSASWLPHDQGHFDEAKLWLRDYFAGDHAQACPAIAFDRGTDFQQRVWTMLREIPLGQTITYGELASRLNATPAVRAVGAAVGRNPISLIIPCHRVVGAKGALTGYAGGLDRKCWLLDHEKAGLMGTRF